jgi:hypothetical protein
MTYGRETRDTKKPVREMVNCIKYDSVTKVTDLKRCLQTYGSTDLRLDISTEQKKIY